MYFLQHVEGREFLFLAVSWEMADVFSLKFQRNKPKKCLGYGFRQGESWIKRLYFQRAVEMKQPYTMTVPYFSVGGRHN